MSKRILFVVLLLVIMPLQGFAITDKYIDNHKLNDTALQLVAEHNNIQITNLEIVNFAKTEYPLTGKTAFHFKISDKRETYGMTLDDKGKELDPEKLLSDEKSAYIAKYGKLEPVLAEKIKEMTDNKPIDVIIWMKEGIYNKSESPTLNIDYTYTKNQSIEKEQSEQFLRKVDEDRAVVVKNIVTPLADELKKQGHDIVIDNSAPVIFTSLTPKEIRQLSKLDSIDIIYLDKTNEPNLNNAVPEILYIPGIGTVPRSIGGYGVKVGVIGKGGRYANNNPYLGYPSVIVQNTTYVCSSPDLHTTGVVGIFRSWDQMFFGISPGAWLWVGGSCSGLSSQLMSRSTAAKDWGAKVLSMSWGHNTSLIPDSSDRFYDSLVYNNRRTVVVSAGNRGCGISDGNVESPGLAYNVITVGNFDDKDTPYWGDVMNPCSSWRDPKSTYNDREKPEVASPGTTIYSTTTSGPSWIGNIGSGTSLSASFVAGEAALLIQRNSKLATWPEAVKAIIMATAENNIEGNTRLSEYDGTGGIVAVRAIDITNPYTIGLVCLPDGRCYESKPWGGISYSCSSPSSLILTYRYLKKDIRTRAVITWDSDPSYSNYNVLPGADLDLRLYSESPVSNLVAESWSWDNTYEIIDFIPDHDGVYSLRVAKQRCSSSPRYLGWAWTDLDYLNVITNNR